MTSRHIVHAAVVHRGIIEADPTRQVCHRLRPGPVRVVLMPCYYSTVVRWFEEDLIVPEPYRSLQQLRGRLKKLRIPQHVVKRGSDSPGSQRVKEHSRLIRRFV